MNLPPATPTPPCSPRTFDNDWDILIVAVGEGVLLASSGWGPEILPEHRTAPRTKNYLATDVSSAKAEIPRSV